MNNRLQSTLAGIVITPIAFAVLLVLFYYGGYYPEKFSQLRWIRISWIILISGSLIGAWFGWQYTELSEEEKPELVIRSAALLIPMLVLNCAWQRLLGSSTNGTDESFRQPIILLLSMLFWVVFMYRRKRGES